MDASLIDFEELDAIEHTRKVCLNCKNTGPAQYGRKYHCNQCGREWKTIEGLRDDPETHRCTLENGASLVWDDYTELWIDTVTGETHAPKAGISIMSATRSGDTTFSQKRRGPQLLPRLALGGFQAVAKAVFVNRRHTSNS